MEIMMEKVERKVMLEVLAPTARGLIEYRKWKEETMMKTVACYEMPNNAIKKKSNQTTEGGGKPHFL
jgi:hypothetical protein